MKFQDKQFSNHLLLFNLHGCILKLVVLSQISLVLFNNTRNSMSQCPRSLIMSKIGVMIFCFSWCYIHVFVFISLCIHFWLLQYIFVVNLSMYNFEKNVIFSIKQLPLCQPTCVFSFQFCYCCRKKTFLRVFMCYVLSVYEKKVIFLIWVCFAFYRVASINSA